MNDFKDFLDKKRRASNRIAAKCALAGKSPTYRMRLRIRLGHRLNSNDTKIKATFRGRRITIQSREPEKPLKESEWVVILATRFRTAEAAAKYGRTLQSSLSIGAAMGNVPIDIGADNSATGSWSTHVKEAVSNLGGFLIDDVHGLSVHPETITAFMMFFGGQISASMSPDRMIELANTVVAKAKKIDDRTRSAALLMNAAMLAPHPAANIVLGIACVELLAAGEKWTERQRTWISSLEEHLAASKGLSAEEKRELLAAVKNLNNFGIAEKNRRLIKHLGLDSNMARWNKLYSGRSKLVHGLGHIPYNELVNLSSEARGLCKAIFDAYVARQLGIIMPI